MTLNLIPKQPSLRAAPATRQSSRAFFCYCHGCPPKLGALGEALAMLAGQALACMQRSGAPEMQRSGVPEHFSVIAMDGMYAENAGAFFCRNDAVLGLARYH